MLQHPAEQSSFRIFNDTQIPCEVTLRVASTGQAVDAAQIAPGEQTVLPVQSQKLLTIEILYGDGVTMKRDLTAGSQGLDFNLSAFHPRGADLGLASAAYQQSAYARGGGGGIGIGGMAFQRAHIGRAGLQQQQQSSSSYGRGLSQWSTGGTIGGGGGGGLASISGAYGYGSTSAGGVFFEARNDADAVVTLTVLSADCTTRAADMTIAPGQTERVQLQPDLYCCFVEKEHGSRLRVDLPLHQPVSWSLAAVINIDGHLAPGAVQVSPARSFTVVNDSRTGCDLSIHRGGSGAELNKVAGVALGPGQVKEFLLDADWYAVNCHFMSGTALKRDINLAKENVQWDLSVIHEIRGAAPRVSLQQQQQQPAVHDADSFYVNRLGSTVGDIGQQQYGLGGGGGYDFGFGGGGSSFQFAPIGQGGLAQRIAARRARFASSGLAGGFARL